MQSYRTQLITLVMVVAGAASASKLARSGQDSGGQSGPAPVAKTAPAGHAARGATAAGSDACKQECVDPVVQAAQRAKDEAAATLHGEICDFLKLYGSHDATSATKNLYCAEIGSAMAFKLVVAVLPKPVESHLPLRFDRSVDELQNSLEDLGWLYDRSWLPWDGKAHNDPDAFEQRQENVHAQDALDESPGVILFHGKDNKPPLIVLTVGDVPTTGVDGKEFEGAIAVWKQLKGWGGDQPPDPAPTLSILGPTYTGSIRSLEQLLKRVVPGKQPGSDGFPCPDKPFRISIVSGTITKDLSDTDLPQPDFGSSGCENLTITPRSFAADDFYPYWQLLAYLVAHDQVQHFATLSEDETSFGNANSISDTEKLDIRSRATRLLQDELTPAERQEVVSILDDACRRHETFELLTKVRDLLKASNAPYPDIPHLTFPREISRLREAYEENQIFGFASTPNTVHTQLHLDLSDTSHGDDSVRVFAGTQNAASLEAEMGQIASTLEAEGIHVLLLNATDVLDEIFVTRYLAEHAPNVTVIVEDADNLFLRGGDTSMQNAYVLSPWPLMAENERWSAAWDDSNLPRFRAHTSAGSQGFYAATRDLLCDPAMTGEKGDCGSADDATKALALPEYQPPLAGASAMNNDLRLRPPLWLSAIGHGGFWPVALVDLDQAAEMLPKPGALNLPLLTEPNHNPDGTEKLAAAPPVRGIFDEAQRTLEVLSGVVGLLVLWHGFACLRARLNRDFAWSYALSDREHHRPRLLLQILISLAAIPMLVLLLPPSLPDMSVTVGRYVWFNYLVQGLALVVVCRPAVLLMYFEDENRKLVNLRANHPGRWVVCLVTAGLTAWAANAWLWDAIAPGAETPTERAFFFYRGGYLFSGSSPNLPLILLGAALVIALMSRFGRLLFYQHRIPQLPSGVPDDPVPGKERLKPLNEFLSGFSGDWKVGQLRLGAWRVGSLIAVIVLVLCACGLLEMVPRSLTHGRFDVAVTVLSGLAVILMLHDLAAATIAWTMLRTQCLVPLSQSPLRWGFTWIKGFSWRRIWAPGGMSRDRLFQYMIRLQQANHRSPTNRPLAIALKDLREAYRKDPWPDEWAGKVTGLMGEVHKALADAAEDKLATLRTEWAEDHGTLTGDAPAERGYAMQLTLEQLGDDPKSPPRTDSLDRMAREEFVALLYLGYIRMVLFQIRNRIMTAAVVYVLLLWALTGYPFLNHHSLVLGLSFLLFVLATVVVYVYAQMHRDEILSRTTETTSGKLDPEFYTRVLPVVGLPLLTLIASQFPEVSSLVFSWIEPSISTLK